MSFGRLSSRAVPACIAVLVSLGVMAVSAGAETVSFTKAGCSVWTAPIAPGAIQVDAVGAAGAAGKTIFPPPGTEGGRGDGVSGGIKPNSGQHLAVCVDQGGGAGAVSPSSSSFAGGEGGGWSGVFSGELQQQATTLVLAAGGGGGSSYFGYVPPNGNGGDAGHPGEPGPGETTSGGGAGTTTEGGSAGKTPCHGQTAGTAFQGGKGGPDCMDDEASRFSAGGGGGGGYFGGGGGASTFENASGGGGGGADFCGNGASECVSRAAAGTVHGAGPGSGEAYVTLTIPTPPAPTIKKVSAASGPATGEKVVRIVGTNFTDITAVEFGGVPATTVVANATGTEIGAVTPSREVAGTVDVLVTTYGGTSAVTAKDHYTYRPVITRVEPNMGTVHGDQQVFVFGAGFMPGGGGIDAFSFGTTTTLEAFCFSATMCEVLTPAHAAEKVHVTATVFGATSAKSKADRYTYN
jgi:IPT/TIG domain